MIKLHQFPAFWGLPNASPFCMKMETYLRMAKLPFEIVVTPDPRKAPKGKLPFIEDNNAKVADSALTIDYLKQKYGDTLDANLSPTQKAQALALQRLMEEHLYWAMVYSRWMEPANWAVVKKTYFSKMPALLRGFVPEMIRKNVMRDLRGHGLGRHNRDEVYQFGKNDITAIATQLANQPFIFGDQPTSIDASAYAFLANILDVPMPSPLQDHAKAQSNLVSYCQRMKERFYA